MSSVFRFLALALSYLIVARLSLLLAIPPGFASPVWPAAGIALAGILLGGYRYLPAVFIGSFVANLSIAADAGGRLTGFLPYAVAAGIALGALLQAAFGAYLARQVVHLPTSLEDEKDIGLLLVLGGPIGCTVNATLAPLTLLMAGTITQENYLITWFTWWVGDTIGVVLLLPAILILAARREQVSKGRKLAVVVPLTVIFILVLGLFFYSRGYSERAVQQEFNQLAAGEGDKVQQKFYLYLEILHSIERFFNSSDFVSKSEFNRYVHGLLKSDTGIETLAWITREGSENQRRYRVHYAEPLELNPGRQGFDVSTCVPCVDAMHDARDSGLPIAISADGIILGENAHKEILIFHPVYESGQPVDSVANRQEFLRGFVLGEFHVAGLIEATMPNLHLLGMTLHFYDNYMAGEVANLYGQEAVGAPFSSRVLLNAAGRQWTLEFYPQNEFLQRNPGWDSWMVLVGGLLFTTLLQALLLVVTARTEVVKRLVDEQTREIRKTNNALENVVQRLHESNAELERFAYVASHDLKEPLRKISSYTSLLERQYGDRFDEKARTYISAANNSADRMRMLIEDILQYARLGNDPERIEQINLNHTMEMVEENLKEVIEQSGAEIIYESLPVVEANPVHMLRLLQNLVSNGIKYQQPFANPQVHVMVEEDADKWLFAVKDNGIGMKQEYCKRIFQPFERLHGKKEYPGTGLGLAICQKIVDGFGGKIWAESKPEEGSVFYFTLPKPAAEQT